SADRPPVLAVSRSRCGSTSTRPVTAPRTASRSRNSIPATSPTPCGSGGRSARGRPSRYRNCRPSFLSRSRTALNTNGVRALSPATGSDSPVRSASVRRDSPPAYAASTAADADRSAGSCSSGTVKLKRSYPHLDGELAGLGVLVHLFDGAQLRGALLQCG